MRFDFLVEHTGDLWVYGALYPRQQPGEKEERRYHAQGTVTLKRLLVRVVSRIYPLGGSPEWPSTS